MTLSFFCFSKKTNKKKRLFPNEFFSVLDIAIPNEKTTIKNGVPIRFASLSFLFLIVIQGEKYINGVH